MQILRSLNIDVKADETQQKYSELKNAYLITFEGVKLEGSEELLRRILLSRPNLQM